MKYPRVACLMKEYGKYMVNWITLVYQQEFYGTFFMNGMKETIL